MFKKMFVLIALMLPVSVFADQNFFANGDNHLYTIKYKVCPELDINTGLCKQWKADSIAQVGPASGSNVSYQVQNTPNGGTVAPYTQLLSVIDEKNISLSQGALTACSGFGVNKIFVFYHLGDERLACKSGGYTRK